MKIIPVSLLSLGLILVSACGKSPTAADHSSTPAAESSTPAAKSELKQAAETVKTEAAKVADTVLKESSNAVEAVKVEGQKLIEQAKSYVAESKFTDANSVLEKLRSLQLTPEQKQMVDQLKAQVDKALESGSAEEVSKLVTDAVRKGIEQRFAHAKETRAHADQSVEAGRKAVAAYVEFTHYVERLYLDAESSAHARHSGNGEAAEPASEHQEHDKDAKPAPAQEHGGTHGT